jgi:SagB-type dehydrogenase family enzyme
MRRRQFVTLFSGALAVLGIGGCHSVQDLAATPFPGGAEPIALPRPRQSQGAPLVQALAHRRSLRQYAAEALSLEEIGQLLWAAQGITADWGGRTAPSAGALYPLELCAVLAEGCYRYDPVEHQMLPQQRGDLREALWQAAVRQDWVREAPLTVVVCAVHERTASRYGERAWRYIQIEIGHAAQNMLLQATALGLAAVPVGAFYEGQVSGALGLADDETPIYMVSMGQPR